MKNFLYSLVVQLVAFATVVSGLVAVACVAVLIFSSDYEVNFLILTASVVVCLAGYIFLRIKKMTWEELLDNLWLGWLPWPW